MHRALTRAGGFLANLGFPTVYAGEADTAICFGENARSLIGKPLPEKLILDSGPRYGNRSRRKSTVRLQGSDKSPGIGIPFFLFNRSFIRFAAETRRKNRLLVSQFFRRHGVGQCGTAPPPSVGILRQRNRPQGARYPLSAAPRPTV